MSQPQDIYWWDIFRNCAMELLCNTVKIKYLHNTVVSPWKGQFHAPENFSPLFVRPCWFHQNVMTFKWHFCGHFEWALSDRDQFCFPVLQLPMHRSRQRHNSCPLHTWPRYVKPTQSTCYHLSFALAYLLRISRNLDCTETPRLQNKVHNMLNSNHPTKSNLILTWTIMLWNSGMNSYTNSLVQPPVSEPWLWNLFWLLRHFLTSAFKNGDIKNLLQLHTWSQNI